MNEGAAKILTPKVSKELMELYLDSIKMDKELSVLICDQKVIPLESESTERTSKVTIRAKDVNDLCKQDKSRIYLHTHANFPPYPSMMDHEANKKIFSLPKIEHSCIAGTSGVFCTDKYGRDVIYPWGSNFFTSIDIDEDISIVRGDALFCDRVVGGEYDCEISLNGFSKPIGRFGNMALQETAIGESGSDILSQVHSPTQMLECILSEDQSTLNCYRKTINEIEQARSTGKRCNYIDVCHPKS